MMTGYAAALGTVVWVMAFSWIYKLPEYLGYWEYDRSVAENCFMRWGTDWTCNSFNLHFIAGLAPIAQAVVWIMLLIIPTKGLWEFYASWIGLGGLYAIPGAYGIVVIFHIIGFITQLGVFSTAYWTAFGLLIGALGFMTGAAVGGAAPIAKLAMDFEGESTKCTCDCPADMNGKIPQFCENRPSVCNKKCPCKCPKDLFGKTPKSCSECPADAVEDKKSEDGELIDDMSLDDFASW